MNSSDRALPPGKRSPDGAARSPAEDGQEQSHCQQCGKALASDWFCRITRGSEATVLCSAQCALRYMDHEPQLPQHSSYGIF